MKPLHSAAKGGDEERVKSLLHDENIDVNKKDHGYTALMYASMEGHSECVRLLAEARADLNIISDSDGMTALMYASMEGRSECVEVLIGAGADLDVRGYYTDKTALMWASHREHSACVALLVAHGADRTIISRQGRTACDLAGHGEAGDVIRKILRE